MTNDICGFCQGQNGHARTCPHFVDDTLERMERMTCKYCIADEKGEHQTIDYKTEKKEWEKHLKHKKVTWIGQPQPTTEIINHTCTGICIGQGRCIYSKTNLGNPVLPTTDEWGEFCKQSEDKFGMTGYQLVSKSYLNTHFLPKSQVKKEIERLRKQNKEATPADKIEEVDERAYDAALTDLENNLGI